MQPRAQGAVRLSAKRRGPRSVIGRLHQQGSLKLLFPHVSGPDLTAVALNTAGGITGGDRFDLRIEAQANTHVTLTTQAAERVYRAAAGTGRVRSGLQVDTGARICWLPQETILFDGAALDRQLEMRMTSDATALLVETVIFGRAAMGEVLSSVSLKDRISVFRDGHLIFTDRTTIQGDVQTHLGRAAIGDGAGAMASLVFAAPDAGDLLETARENLPASAGLSQPARDVLFARLLAPDGYTLRQMLIPLIARFRASPLPRPWMI